MTFPLCWHAIDHRVFQSNLIPYARQLLQTYAFSYVTSIYFRSSGIISNWMNQPKLTDAQHEALATRLYAAMHAGQGIDPPSETIDYNLDDAYRIRRKLVDKLIAAGARPCGHKIGFTAEVMQRMYGMSGPDFGILTDVMMVKSGEQVRVSNLCNTRAEPELAFELARPLTGPNISIADAIAATRRVWAAIEVIDSRVGAMRAKANDSVADNAGAGWVILGEFGLEPAQLQLDQIQLAIEIDGNQQQGLSSEVMGHPAAPLAWLANKLHELDGLGGSLMPGDIVITGAPVRSVAVQAGSHLHASFGPLGDIDISFI
jgi:2-keto-4-pentenoate hydratase